MGVPLVVVTDGSRGCGMALDAHRVHCLVVPAPRGVRQVDATGAGDAFFGGLVAGLYHRGLPRSAEELRTLGGAASALGATCCEALGALPGSSSAERARALLPDGLERHLREYR